MSALETSQRTDEPETSPSPADEQTQVGTGARSSLPREELLRLHGLHPMPGYPDRLQVLGNAAPESAGLGCHPGLCISNKFSSNVDVARLANLNKQSIFLKKSLSMPEIFTLPATEAKACETKIQDNGPEQLCSSVYVYLALSTAPASFRHPINTHIR